MTTQSPHPSASRSAGISWYHSIDLGEAGLTPGTYDHGEYLPFYGFPDDMRGMSVLDVGAGDGFFSFHFERAGARVLAINPPAWSAEDYLPIHAGDWAQENSGPDESPLLLARDLLGSKVEYRRMVVYDLSPETVGVHDLTFCGSVLCHLMNPLLALIRLRSVTKGTAVISTLVHDEPELRGRPAMLFAGPGYVHTFFIPNVACLGEMILAAGFRGFTHVSSFTLRSRTPPWEGGAHAVIHAHA
jgi:tRNA (mo5U34)-methyltransferase